MKAGILIQFPCRQLILTLALLLSGTFYSSGLKAQKNTPKYWVQFTDKDNTPYTLSQPAAFLSQRALERRAKQNIILKENDLPVDPAYIAAVAATGAQVLVRSKWMNAVVISLTDTALLSQIKAFPFVKQVKYEGYSKEKQERGESVPWNKWEQLSELNNGWKNTVFVSGTRELKNERVYQYGPSANQIQMINADVLHSYGFRGQGIIIAVLDAGFYQADILPAFDSLRAEGRLLGAVDFAEPGGNVFAASTHGMQVLSTMAANVPGEIIGTAPKASYWLLRTEVTGTETPVEEDFWVAAAEFADSLGADIINSSLGYTVFDDFTQNYSYSDMDGNTTHVTIGADMAASKGILVLSSAGNMGGSFWQYIGAPADGDSVLTVGAVTANGYYATFSSTGPSADGRIKPNVVAQGEGTIIYSALGGVIPGNGTSFSSPVLAGAAACLWQAHPACTNMEILQAIEKSASKYLTPDSLFGYGIPDLVKADQALYIPPVIDSIQRFSLYPNPSRDNLNVKIYLNDYQKVTIELFEPAGRLVAPSISWQGHPGENIYFLEEMTVLSPGFYLLRIKAGFDTYQSIWLKM